MQKSKKVLVTGVAGFIGFHTAVKLLKKNYSVLGIDSINNYYSQTLKKDRLSEIKKNYKGKNFKFLKANLNNKQALEEIIKFNPAYIIHLAAQAGVRKSIENPHLYLNNNINATLNLFETSRNLKNLNHFIYASTSSVYGLSTDFPLSESNATNHPLQFYAVTKKATELMAHSYAAVHNIPSTGLRFFTVYGPWGRPDMALYKFTSNIMKNKIIDVFGHGKHIRDFTYIDDIVSGIINIIDETPKYSSTFDKKSSVSGESTYPFRILNIGGGAPVNLMSYIKEIEKNLGKKAKINYLDFQPGDMLKTHSDTTKISKYGYSAKTPISVGVKNFVEWYLDYHNI